MLWIILGGVVVYLAVSYFTNWWVVLDKGKARGGPFGIDYLMFPLAPLLFPILLFGMTLRFFEKLKRKLSK